MRIGILGGGQLARMLALSAIPLGFDILCLEKEANTCAAPAANILVGAFDDEDIIKKFASSVDVVTYETENLPLSLAQHAEKYCPVFPSVESLEICQDRLFEKTFCQRLDIPTAGFLAIHSLEELLEVLQTFSLPAILKTRRSGYDGKGQYLIKSKTDAQTAWQTLQSDSLIIEEFFPFDEEASMIAVRDRNKNISFYPLIHNTHQQGILRLSIAPYENEILQMLAQQHTTAILNALDYVGVLGVEFFVKNNLLYVNEMAPRVHNSGHWTIEGSVTSQFENHIRAITGNTIGDTECKGYSAMWNNIGAEPPMSEILKLSGLHFHTYGKQPRPGRKLGHITLNCPDKEIFDVYLERYKGLMLGRKG